MVASATMPLAQRAGRYCAHPATIPPSHLCCNKSQVVSVTMPLAQQAGYYCNVCDCILRDSQSYLDHINGGSGSL